MSFFINREFDYAVRICAFLSGRRDAKFTASEISRLTAVSPSFTRKIVHGLRKAGILSAQRGRNGGIYLAKPPESIDLYFLLTSINFKFNLNECTVKPTICPFSDNCKIHNFFADTEEMLINHFKGKTIADIAFNHFTLIKEQSIQIN